MRLLRRISSTTLALAVLAAAATPLSASALDDAGAERENSFGTDSLDPSLLATGVSEDQFILIVASGESFAEALVRQAQQNPGRAEVMLPIVEAAAAENNFTFMSEELDRTELEAAANSLRGELGRTTIDSRAGLSTAGWVDQASIDTDSDRGVELAPIAASPTFEGQQMLQIFVCDSNGCTEVARAIHDSVIDLGFTTVRLNGKVTRGIGWSGFSAPIQCLRGSTSCGSNTLPVGNFFQFPKDWQLTGSMNGATMRVTFSGSYYGTFATVTGDTPSVSCTGSGSTGFCTFN